MRNVCLLFACAALIAVAGIVPLAAQDEEGGPSAFPIESFLCSFVDGAGASELDDWTADWNSWADGAGVDDYWAATLVPYYFNANQEFDLIWLGASSNATDLGRAQDKWVAEGAALRSALAEIVECSEHSNWAALTFRKPPEESSPDSFVMSYSDCNLNEDVTFDDIAPALAEWAEYTADNGSLGPIWAFFPAYGGGGEKFDFKYVAGHKSLEAQGASWDAYATGGYEKATELFAGKLDCDSSRVYLGTTRRRPTPPAE